MSEPLTSPALRRLDVLVGEWRVEPSELPSGSGDRNHGRWEIAGDGTSREHDFDLAHLRTGGRGT